MNLSTWRIAAVAFAAGAVGGLLSGGLASVFAQQTASSAFAQKTAATAAPASALPQARRNPDFGVITARELRMVNKQNKPYAHLVALDDGTPMLKLIDSSGNQRVTLYAAKDARVSVSDPAGNSTVWMSASGGDSILSVEGGKTGSDVVLASRNTGAAAIDIHSPRRVSRFTALATPESTRFALSDPAGVTRAEFTAVKEGKALLALHDPKGQGRVKLGASNAGSTLELADAQGKTRANSIVTGAGDPYVQMLKGDGKLWLQAGPGKTRDACYLFMFDNQGNPVFKAPAGSAPKPSQ